MRRLATPRWLLVHVATLGLVVAMVNLGLWQLDRLDAKRTLNDAVAVRSSSPVVDLGELLPTGTDATATLEWRRVTATGTWLGEGAVTVLNRSAEGVAGVHSVVPVRLGDGRTLLVNRGFVPLVEQVAAPTGEVTVAGYLRRSEKRGTLGAVDSVDPSTREFQRLDVALVGARVGGDVVPMWLQLVDQSPRATDDWPAAIPLPVADEGPHLSYAFQWFFFSLVAVAGWGVAARRSMRAPLVVSSDQVELTDAADGNDVSASASP